jgi:hypothetical protein
MALTERRKTQRRPADAKDKGPESDLNRLSEEVFKVTVRRHKLLGLWAAERMGITGDAAEAYAKEVIGSDFEEPGSNGVVRMVMKDLANKGVDMNEDRLRQEIAILHEVARRQIEAQRP